MNILHVKQALIRPQEESFRLEYDKETDILEIFFGENEPAAGIELTDQILLRIHQATGRAVSLTLRHFSMLVERTEYGPRSYPLHNLNALPENLRDVVMRVMTAPPVNQFLKLSYFQASQTKRIPVTYVEPPRLAAAA